MQLLEFVAEPVTLFARVASDLAKPAADWPEDGIGRGWYLLHTRSSIVQTAEVEISVTVHSLRSPKMPEAARAPARHVRRRPPGLRTPPEGVAW